MGKCEPWRASVSGVVQTNKPLLAMVWGAGAMAISVRRLSTSAARHGLPAVGGVDLKLLRENFDAAKENYSLRYPERDSVVVDEV